MPTFDAATESNPAHREMSPEPHFGDLRKGAFLKRRAAYLLQLDHPATAPSANDRTDRH